MSSRPRAPDELRPVHFELDFVRYPEGSVLVSVGDTKVLCNATVENKLPPWLRYCQGAARMGDGRVCHAAAQHLRPQPA